jgi:uridine phosphorylase
MNELDALANINFDEQNRKAEIKSLSIVRIGTTGGLQEDLPPGTFLISEKSIGLDGLLNFYAAATNFRLEIRKGFLQSYRLS